MAFNKRKIDPNSCTIDQDAINVLKEILRACCPGKSWEISQLCIMSLAEFAGKFLQAADTLYRYLIKKVGSSIYRVGPLQVIEAFANPQRLEEMRNKFSDVNLWDLLPFIPLTLGQYLLMRLMLVCIYKAKTNSFQLDVENTNITIKGIEKLPEGLQDGQNVIIHMGRVYLPKTLARLEASNYLLLRRRMSSDMTFRAIWIAMKEHNNTCIDLTNVKLI